MKNIIFIGMPAVGKSAIGVILAKKIGYQFIDTDLLIQEKTGHLLKDIISEKGIDAFLKIEDEVNSQVNVDKAIISPGGSVVYCENAMKHYKKIGTVVYLKASFEMISPRLGNTTRRGVVLRDGQTLKDLYNERVKLFEKYADITVNQDYASLMQNVERVVAALEENESQPLSV
jgi:Shikimate kinase